MIVSKTKGNSLFAISLFLALALVSFFLLFDSLLRSEDWFTVKLILAILIAVILFMVFTRFTRNMQTVRAGQDKIEVKQWLSGKTTTVKLKDIPGWKEEVVKNKSGDYRELKILLPDKKTIRLSNKEHTHYKEVGQYLDKKLAKKKVRL